MSSFKKSVLKTEICNFLPNTTFLPELQMARNQTCMYFQPPWPTSQHSGEGMLKRDVLCSFIQTRAVKGTAFLSLYVYKLLWKTWNLEVCFRTCVGTDQAKFEKNLISRQIWLGFLHSLVSAVRCEANKSNWQRNERPFGSHSSKYWSACSVVHAQSRTVCGGGKRACESTDAHTGQCDVKERSTQ